MTPVTLLQNWNIEHICCSDRVVHVLWLPENCFLFLVPTLVEYLCGQSQDSRIHVSYALISACADVKRANELISFIQYKWK